MREKILAWFWVCELPGCGYRWLAEGIDAPPKCSKCKKRGWHTRSGSIVPDAGSIGATSPEVVESEMDRAEVPIPRDEMLANLRTVVADVMDKTDLAPLEPIEREPCTYTEPEYESGNVYACPLHLGHKGRHVRGPIVGDIW